MLAGSLPADTNNKALSPAEQQHKTNELDKLRQRMRTLRDELSETRNLHDSVQQTLSKIETKIGQQVSRLKRLSKNIKTQQRRLSTLKKDKYRQNKTLSTQQNLLSRQIKAAYINGRQEFLKLLLNQEDPGTVGRTLVYYDYFNRARSEQINKVQTILEKINVLTTEINSKTTYLKSSRTKRRNEKRNLEKTYQSRALVLAKLNSDIKNKDQQLTRLSEDEKRLQQILNAIDQAMPDILTEIEHNKPFASYKGKLRWPVKGKLKKLYGKSRNAGKLRWNGVMIDATRGREIHSISHGRVAYADWLRGYGLLLIIDHGDGYMSLYGHNQSLYKETGDWVDANEVIAEIGDTGGQKTTGLYFEIRYKGKPTNPLYWCKRARS